MGFIAWDMMPHLTTPGGHHCDISFPSFPEFPVGTAGRNSQGPRREVVLGNIALLRSRFVPVDQAKEILRDGELKETPGLSQIPQQPQGSPSLRMNNDDDGVIPDEKAHLGSATIAPQPVVDCALYAFARCLGSGNEPQLPITSNCRATSSPTFLWISSKRAAMTGFSRSKVGSHRGP